MEWCFGGNNVPKDQGTPGYLLPSCQSKLEGLPNKYINHAIESTRGELGYDQKSSIYERKEQPNGWTACEEFQLDDWGCDNQEAYLQRTETLGDQMDYQLDCLEEMNRTDDIFLSVQEGDPTEMHNRHQAVGLVPEFESSSISFHNFSTDMTTESQSIFMEPTEMDSPNYFGSCNFSQSVEWENFEDDVTSLLTPDTGQAKGSKATKAPVTAFDTSDERFTSSEPVEKTDTSLEAMVLRQLEVVTSKMQKNTRLCFRDALYRLARCSKQRRFLINEQNEEMSFGAPRSVHHEASRSGRVQLMELGTNSTDRVIANLMFNTFNCDDEALSSIASLNLSDEACIKEKRYDYCLKTSNIAPYHSPEVLLHDAEVPIF